MDSAFLEVGRLKCFYPGASEASGVATSQGVTLYSTGVFNPSSPLFIYLGFFNLLYFKRCILDCDLIMVNIDMERCIFYIEQKKDIKLTSLQNMVACN